MLRASNQVYIFFTLIIIVYALNIGGSAIWTTHEAYYAEAVREMLASGVWSEFFFNHEPRFQKPPLTYWLMATSAYMFGMSEFTLRLPIVICSLITIWTVYKIGKLLYDTKIGLISMLAFSVGLQFIWFKHYASPEIILTCLFTLSLYSYLTGWRYTKMHWTYLSFVLVGLAALTKGFPFIILFFLIVGMHKVMAKESKPETPTILILIVGLLISTIIGLSWHLYMTWQQGDAFTQMWMSETFDRAIDHPTGPGFLEGLFFYPQSILWGFFPFSLVFFYALIRTFLDRELWTNLQLPLIWFGVFLVVLTISSGKLPVYMLPAYPAMALIVGYTIVRGDLIRSFNKQALKLCLWFPAVLIILSSYFLINRFDLDVRLYVPFMLAISFGVYQLIKYRDQYQQLIVLWGLKMALMTIVFVGLMPWVEQFRPYRELQEVITERAPESAPLFIEDRFLDNMPYYAQRKTHGGPQWNIRAISEEQSPKLVLAKLDAGGIMSDGTILWEGLIHSNGPEDHFFKFIRDCYLLSKGDSARFTTYQLILLE